jgi:D-psicose/D-tagatose/L-ribulose 3-epimerase
VRRLRFAYNTNGTQNHRLEHAVELIADAGYDGIALSLDVHHLDPYAPFLPSRALKLGERLSALGLGSVIETGARYLLDPRDKHEPTLVSASAEGREKRVDFLRRCVDVAAVLGSECVSFWGGVPRAGVERSLAREWLLEGVDAVRNYASTKDVIVALEPEPGMAIGDLDEFVSVMPADLPLALHTGHCLVTGERDPAAAVREFAGRLATITVEDMRRGEHVHLPFGEGDMDVPAVLDAIESIGWQGLVCVELSRDSHRAHEMVPAALAALRRS